MRIDTDLWVRVKTEAEGLGQTRTKFVERALEQALEGHAPNSLELAAKLKEMWHNDPVLERQLVSQLVSQLPPGVKTGADVMRERQTKLNKERGT